MLFDTRSTQAAEASLDALWLKTQVIANNMANVDTPGFKGSNVGFEEVLRTASQSRSGAGSADRGPNDYRNAEEPDKGQNDFVGRNASQGGTRYRTTVASDGNASVRVDGNNVVLEQQQAELWKTYAQYSYLLDRVSGHYRNIGTAISNMRG